MPAKTGRKQARDALGRFLPGRSGNPNGRPTGSRHRATVAALELLEGEAEALTRKAVDLAKAGNLEALRLCLSRIVPVAKDKPVNVTLPRLQVSGDAVSAVAELLDQVAAGELTPTEAAAVASLVETARRAIETEELERRVKEVEKALEARS